MKKLILVSMLLLGMLTFAERFTSPNKRLEISLKENAEEQSPAGYFGYNEEGEADRYSFFIVTDNAKEISLVQSYESKEKAGGKISETYLDDPATGTVPTVFGTYKVYRDNKKGIYYVNNYVDLQGKKHAKLYFGFDKKRNTIVILDKNMNIVEVLQRGAAGYYSQLGIFYQQFWNKNLICKRGCLKIVKIKYNI